MPTYDTQYCNETQCRYNTFAKTSYKRKKGRNRSITMANCISQKTYLKMRNCFVFSLQLVANTVFLPQVLQCWIPSVNAKQNTKGNSDTLQNTKPLCKLLREFSPKIFNHRIESAEATRPHTPCAHTAALKAIWIITTHVLCGKVQ